MKFMKIKSLKYYSGHCISVTLYTYVCRNACVEVIPCVMATAPKSLMVLASVGPIIKVIFDHNRLVNDLNEFS